MVELAKSINCQLTNSLEIVAKEEYFEYIQSKLSNSGKSLSESKMYSVNEVLEISRYRFDDKSSKLIDKIYSYMVNFHQNINLQNLKEHILKSLANIQYSNENNLNIQINYIEPNSKYFIFPEVEEDTKDIFIKYINRKINNLQWFNKEHMLYNIMILNSISNDNYKEELLSNPLTKIEELCKDFNMPIIFSKGMQFKFLSNTRYIRHFILDKTTQTHPYEKNVRQLAGIW